MGWGGRGAEDFGGCWGTAVTGRDVAGVRFGVKWDMLAIAGSLDATAFDRRLV